MLKVQFYIFFCQIFLEEKNDKEFFMHSEVNVTNKSRLYLSYMLVYIHKPIIVLL